MSLLDEIAWWDEVEARHRLSECEDDCPICREEKRERERWNEGKRGRVE